MSKDFRGAHIKCVMGAGAPQFYRLSKSQLFWRLFIAENESFPPLFYLLIISLCPPPLAFPMIPSVFLPSYPSPLCTSLLLPFFFPCPPFCSLLSHHPNLKFVMYGHPAGSAATESHWLYFLVVNTISIINLPH